MVFLILLLIPLFIAVVGFITLGTINWKEFAVQVGVQMLVAGASAAIIYSQNTGDTETLNGHVTGKEQTWVSCSHSYSCNCHEVCRGSGKDRYCSEECDTCYEHANDWDWDVFTTVGNIEIDRIDRRGTYEPPRWTAVRIGEPVALPHTYTNYIKAAPDTLFRHQGLGAKYTGKIPVYPQVFDYYRQNRLVVVGAQVPDAQKWNDGLADLNSRLGAPKQVNVMVVLVHGLPHDYFYALEEAWLGGKKNEAILVLGVTQDLKPEWASVMAWTTNEEFKVQLYHEALELPVIAPETVLPLLAEKVQKLYSRKPMADFEYLSASISPTPTQWTIAFLIGLVVSLGLLVFMHMNELFNTRRKQ